MTWLDVGWHFDLVVGLVLVLPSVVALTYLVWRDALVDDREQRERSREQALWREWLDESSFRERLRERV